MKKIHFVEVLVHYLLARHLGTSLIDLSQHRILFHGLEPRITGIEKCHATHDASSSDFLREEVERKRENAGVNGHLLDHQENPIDDLLMNVGILEIELLLRFLLHFGLDLFLEQPDVVSWRFDVEVAACHFDDFNLHVHELLCELVHDLVQLDEPVAKSVVVVGDWRRVLAQLGHTLLIDH